jgi:hypothetical protein
VNSKSALTKKALAVTECASVMQRVLSWVDVNGPIVQKLGDQIGIAVSAVDLANEIREAHSDLEGVETMTITNPNRALAAADKLK